MLTPGKMILSEKVASSPLVIITDLAFLPPLQPLLFLTFSDIYPPPQWQHPAHSHQPAWVSLCGLVSWKSYKGRTEWKKSGGQTVRGEKEKAQTRVQNTSAAAALTPCLFLLYWYTHAHPSMPSFELVCGHPLWRETERKGHAQREGRADKERMEKQ